MQLRDIQDPETGERYTVKRYRSEKEPEGPGSWRHAEVRLEPENRDFAPIILRDVPEGEIKVVGESSRFSNRHDGEDFPPSPQLARDSTPCS